MSLGSPADASQMYSAYLCAGCEPQGRRRRRRTSCCVTWASLFLFPSLTNCRQGVWGMELALLIPDTLGNCG